MNIKSANDTLDCFVLYMKYEALYSNLGCPNTLFIIRIITCLKIDAE